MKPLPDVLASIPFLAGLTPEEVSRLVEVGETRVYERNRTIFAQGDPGEELYVILSGSVEIAKKREERESLILALLGEGAYFGEMAVVDQGERSATAIAKETTNVFVLRRESLLGLLSSSEHILSEMLRNLSGHVRTSTTQLLDSKIESDRLRTEGELERHRAISQMVAGVAHEINTPLGIVNNAASVITDALRADEISALAKDEEAEEILEDLAEAAKLIQSNIERANRLIRSFKDLSARQASDSLERVDLEALVAEVVGLFRIEAKRASIELEVTSRLEDRKEWYGFPGHLSQILLNLLRNAERYAYPDGQGGKVEVVVREMGSLPWYVVEVRDFGVGMDAESVAKVYEPFFTTGRGRGGTGLGMAIVRNLVGSSLQGAIDFKSSPGEGTTVTVSFPMELPESPKSDGGAK